ncbi:MAG: hypothetical protein WC889_08935 [Myxococcota bacterium]|jgi:hypothetical protein
MKASRSFSLIAAALTATALAATVAHQGCSSKQDAANISSALAEELGDDLGVVGAAAVTDTPVPAENSGKEGYPQIKDVDSPSSLLAGQSYMVSVTPAPGGIPSALSAEISCVIIWIPPARKYYRLDASVDETGRINFYGKLKFDKEVPHLRYRVKLALCRPDGEIGNYYNWIFDYVPVSFDCPGLCAICGDQLGETCMESCSSMYGNYQEPLLEAVTKCMSQPQATCSQVNSCAESAMQNCKKTEGYLGSIAAFCGVATRCADGPATLVECQRQYGGLLNVCIGDYGLARFGRCLAWARDLGECKSTSILQEKINLCMGSAF